jgi:hypothetical protein
VNDVFVASGASAAIGIAFLVMGIAAGKSAFEYVNAIVGVMFNRSVSAHYQKQIFRHVVSKDVWHFSGQHASMQMAQIKLFGRPAARPSWASATRS